MDFMDIEQFSPRDEFVVADVTSSPPENHTMHTSSSPTPAIDKNPLFNKYVVIGGLSFLAAILVVAVIFHLLRKRIRSKSHSHNLYSEVAGDNCSLDEHDHYDSHDLYTTCQLHVGDFEVNSMSSDFEYDSIYVENDLERGMFVNGNPESVHADGLDSSRSVLANHFAFK